MQSFGNSRFGLVAASLMACLATLGLPARSAPLKCVDTSGRITYTDIPCPEAPRQSEVKIVDNAADASQDRRALMDGRAGMRPAPFAQLGPVPSQAGSLTVQGPSCSTARRDYDVAVSSVEQDVDAMNRRYRKALSACGSGFELLPAHERVARARALQHTAPTRGTRHDSATRADIKPRLIVKE